MPTAVVLFGILFVGACNTFPLFTDEDIRATQCLKAHMTPKKLPDGRVVCITR